MSVIGPNILEYSSIWGKSVPNVISIICGGKNACLEEKYF